MFRIKDTDRQFLEIGALRVHLRNPIDTDVDPVQPECSARDMFGNCSADLKLCVVYLLDLVYLDVLSQLLLLLVRLAYDPEGTHSATDTSGRRLEGDENVDGLTRVKHHDRLLRGNRYCADDDQENGHQDCLHVCRCSLFEVAISGRAS